MGASFFEFADQVSSMARLMGPDPEDAVLVKQSRGWVVPESNLELRPRPVKWCMRIRRHPRLVGGHDAAARVGVWGSTAAVSRALVSVS